MTATNIDLEALRQKTEAALTSSQEVSDQLDEIIADITALLGEQPPEPPVITNLVVHADNGGNLALTDIEYRAQDVRCLWRNKGGDWIDAEGVIQGPAATITAMGPDVTVDIRGLPNELFIQGINMVTNVIIDGEEVTNECCWTDPTSNNGLAMPSHYGRGVIVPNRGGHSMRVISNASASTEWRVDAIFLEPVPDYAPTGTYTHPDIMLVECSNENAILHPPGIQTVPAGPWAMAPEFMSENGFDYVRLGTSKALDGRLVNVRFQFPRPLNEVYTGEFIYIEDDVWDGMHDLGIKLCGIGTTVPAGTPPADSSGFWCFMEQSACYDSSRLTKGLLNRNVFGLDKYTRDGDTGPGAITEQMKANALLTTNRWYWMERYVKLNTIGQADGIERHWLNGHLILERTDRKWRNMTDLKWDGYTLQIYLGGVNKWLSPVHYRVAKLSISSKPIGVPPGVIS